MRPARERRFPVRACDDVHRSIELGVDVQDGVEVEDVARDSLDHEIGDAEAVPTIGIAPGGAASRTAPVWLCLSRAQVGRAPLLIPTLLTNEIISVISVRPRRRTSSNNHRAARDIRMMPAAAASAARSALSPP
jgi:hypothetical protein